MSPSLPNKKIRPDRIATGPFCLMAADFLGWSNQLSLYESMSFNGLDQKSIWRGWQNCALSKNGLSNV
jgi:hypothetical protein